MNRPQMPWPDAGQDFLQGALTCLCLCAIAVPGNAADQLPYRNQNLAVEARIRDLDAFMGWLTALGNGR